MRLGILRENALKYLYILSKFYLLRCFIVEGHLSEREGYALYKLAKSFKRPIKILEIGAYKGKSSNFLARAGKNQIYIIDTFTNIDMSEGPKNTYEDFLRNTKKVQNCFKVIIGNSADSSTIAAIPNDVSLIFLDADHNYESVKKDIDNYQGKLITGGFFIFHDYGNPTGVKLAVDEKIAQGKLINIMCVDSMIICRVP